LSNDSGYIEEAGMKAVFQATLFSVAGIALLALFSGCGPSYPACFEDQDCAEKKQYCLNGKCAQCRDDRHCSQAIDEAHVCNAGTCHRIAGYCNPAAGFNCPAGQKCRDRRCGPECFPETVAEDCPAGFTCENGRCTPPPDCLSDADCPDGKICVNQKCVEPTVCQPREVNFDFDQSEITSLAKRTLEENYSCYQERGEKINNVNVTGHCDDRGTDEYNMRLGQRRANAVDKLYRKLGIDKKKIRVNSRGEMEPVVPNARSEGEHARNRRAETKFE
jgi:peptidoglycan-associated lipoprotein